MQKWIIILRNIFKFFLIIFPATHASAKTCDNFFVLESKQPRTAIVTSDAGSRLHFQRDGAKCPGEKGCDTKAYLLPDDKVFIVDDGDQWVCAYFNGPKRDTVGWLPRAALIIDTTPALPVQDDWVGRWHSKENLLLFERRQGGRLFVRGWAVGEGYSLSAFDVETTPTGNQVVYKGARCRITLRWVAGFILASNTQDCVGAGNTYYGVYHRTALTTDPKDDPEP